MDLYDNKNLIPMLLNEVEKPFNDPDYLFELKFDGIRALIYVDKKNIIIKNRNGININNIFPELLEVKNMVTNKCIFDGEITSMINEKPSFNQLQKRALLKDPIKINYYKENYPVVFICFDILYDKKDITDLPLIDRKKYLEKYPDNNFFIKSKYIFEKGISLFDEVKKLNLEGIVAKEIKSKYYYNQRSKVWLKIKNVKDEDFFIGGYKLNKKTSVLASLILGRKENNKLYYVGNVSIGKRNPAFVIIQKEKELNKSPFIDFNEDNITYLKPNLMCSITFLEKTKTGSLRHPIFKELK